MKTLGKNLKEARKAVNLTLEELAAKYNNTFGGGLSKGTLSKYENGKQEPMSSVVSNLATILNVTTDFLMGNTTDFNKWDNENTPKLATEVNLIEEIEKRHSKQAAKGFGLFVALDDADQGRVVERMETMLEAEKYQKKEGLSVKKAT